MDMDAVWREIEARETAFRMDLDLDERRKRPPFFAVASTDFGPDIEEIEAALDAGHVDSLNIIERLTKLLEAHYGKRYPV